DARLGFSGALLTKTGETRETRALGPCGRQRRLNGGKLILERTTLALFERQQARQLRDLQVELAERRILPTRLLADEKLSEHEQRKQEHEDEQQRRHDIDIAGPELPVLIGSP